MNGVHNTKFFVVTIKGNHNTVSLLHSTGRFECFGPLSDSFYNCPMAWDREWTEDNEAFLRTRDQPAILEFKNGGKEAGTLEAKS